MISYVGIRGGGSFGTGLTADCQVTFSIVTSTFVPGELFVGRRDELTRLQTLLDGFSAGVGGLVLVEGEQGIGKSSLLRAGLAGAESSGFRCCGRRRMRWGSGSRCR